MKNDFLQIFNNQISILNNKKKKNKYYENIKNQLLLSLLYPDLYEIEDSLKIIQLYFEYGNKEIYDKYFVKQIVKFNNEKIKDEYIELMKILFSHININFDIQDIISENKQLFKELEVKVGNTNSNLENVNNKITSFFDINLQNSIICLKRDLLLTDLSIFFNNIYFNDKYFYFLFLSFNENHIKSMKNSNNSEIYNTEFYIPFPSKIKNFSNSNLFIPKIFLTCDTKYFESPTFSIGHPYFQIEKLKKLKPLISHYLPTNNNGLLFYGDNFYYPNEIILICDCELITNKDIFFGTLKLTKQYCIFLSKNNFDEYDNNIEYIFSNEKQDLSTRDKQVIIKYNEIEEIFMRRFLFMYQALEIFLLNGKSYFFNFFKIEKANKFIDNIKYIKELNKLNFLIVENPIEHLEKEKIKLKWYEREIDTFQFLLYVNKYGGRSYNDLNQYPIIPWIVLKFFPKNDIYHYKYRDLIFPISIQNENQKEVAKNKFISSKEDSDFQFHFNLHYSNSSYVILYLVRLSPFTEGQIKLQKQCFDDPNRQIISFDSLINLLLIGKDNRELIPDLFISFEYFYNLNYNFFGIKISDDQLVNNISIPYSFNSPAEFVYYMKYLYINDQQIKETINEWIDNIFGINQYDNKPKLEYFNTFNPYSYGQYNKFMSIINNKDLNEDEKKNSISIRKISCLSFGQTPEQIFKKTTKYQYKENEKEKIIDPIIDNLLIISNFKKTVNISKNEVINFWLVKNENELFYFLIRDNSKLNNNYSISVWEFKKKFKFLYSINISSIKLFRKKVEEKLQNEENIFYIYKLNPKFIMFEILNCQYFFVGRNDDNSLKIYTFNEKLKTFPKKIKINSFISTLYKINENTFISGHLNGRIMEWEINNNLDLTIKRDIFAHNDTMICAINYINKHNIIATSAEDGNIYIRKYYNFELLTIIKLNKNEYANDILFSNYDMYYILKFNKNNMKFNFDIYSINGINVIQKNCDLYIQNFYCIDNGKIVFTLKSNNNVFYYCLLGDIINIYKIGNDKINNFIYYEKNYIFYIISENGDLIRFEENELTFLLNEIKRNTNKNLIT